jgi:hypothetical protein
MQRIFTKFPLGLGISFQTMPPLGARQLLVRCGLALIIMPAAVQAQKIQSPPPNARKIHSIARTARTDSRPTPETHEPMSNQPPPLPLLTTEQTVPNPPWVSYEGGQLTIIAENSELSDVLSLLRACTGADIDFPPSAAHERIWAGLGPGPARRVLAALLGGIGLDYAIQASDIDPQGVRRVLLSTRTRPASQEPPGQENPPSQGPDASSEAAPENLQSVAEELQPAPETPASRTNEAATSPQVAPVEVQPSPEAAYGVAANQTPYDDIIATDPDANSAEDLPLAVYTGESNVVGGMTADVVVYDSGGVLVIIWNDAEDKLLGVPRAIFVGDPSRLRHHSELSNWK